MDLDESVIGLTGEMYEFKVESRHVSQFYTAIGDDNLLYRDAKYAQNSVYEGMIVPPTFPVAMIHPDIDFPLELDHRRMLHGEQEFIYYKPIRIGDNITCQMKVHDLYEREGKSGNMQFLVLDTEMKDQSGDVVCINRMNIIYRSLS